MRANGRCPLALAALLGVILLGGLAVTAQARMDNPRKAGPMFPPGTMVSEVDVPGGIDLVFWGPDLDGIVSVLKGHQAQCGDEKSTNGTTCSVTSNSACADMAVRGRDPESCCAGLMAEGGGRR